MTIATFALLVTPEAEVIPVDLPADTGERLTAMYSLIHCDNVDVVALTDQLDMWLDDEGLYTQRVNPLATLFAGRFGRTYQSYHGPVLLTGGANSEGDTLPLTKDQVLALLASLADF
ncbi:DUF3846 domain-containing protein [Streptomyces sp. A1136]|uniref:DUF3846 domain-containing protein n=1 Tax=Streptomyces sp. A1136 TaxID=2563102 RepID=UPI00109EAB71|nr:DUF3846 domain-containing protein [Streptomyces sp. A1136]THA53268.1 DUF3846 domain-containing protein [Streptomyces sp. A1136]